MDASIRIFASACCDRHLSRSILNPNSVFLPQKLLPPTVPISPRRFKYSSSIRNSFSSYSVSSFNHPNSLHRILLSLSLSHTFALSPNRLSQFGFDLKEGWSLFKQNHVDTCERSIRYWGDKSSDFTVVLLGWLGADHKQLKKYAEIYSSRGVRVVTFIVQVKDLLGFDLGRKVEHRIVALSQELISWVSNTRGNGRDRCLLFHTFSNTGWFVYGAILDYLLSHGDLNEKIRGCVVDSGADPEINPKVWAAGFTAALLKKRSTTSNYASISQLDTLDNNGKSESIGSDPSLSEALLLSFLERFFSVFLELPAVNERLEKIIHILQNKQPCCPQLYLYSRSDNVIPFQSIELFIKKQESMGRRVNAYNFETSPHVDHLRNFPDIYTTEIDKHLKSCIYLDKVQVQIKRDTT